MNISSLFMIPFIGIQSKAMSRVDYEWLIGVGGWTGGDFITQLQNDEHQIDYHQFIVLL